MDNKENCECESCKLSRKFNEHINNMNDKDMKKFFINLFNNYYGLQEDFDVKSIYLENLKTLYPKIWKEVCVIRKLDKNEANHPEIQI